MSYADTFKKLLNAGAAAPSLVDRLPSSQEEADAEIDTNSVRKIRVGVIEDSISPGGHRLTTIYAEYPRYIHADMLHPDIRCTPEPIAGARQRSIFTASNWIDFLVGKLVPGENAPDMVVLAQKVRNAIMDSHPVQRGHHLPFLADDERDDPDAMKRSVVRCHWLADAGLAKYEIELSLFDALVKGKGLGSAFYHPAEAARDGTWSETNVAAR